MYLFYSFIHFYIENVFNYEYVYNICAHVGTQPIWLEADNNIES